MSSRAVSGGGNQSAAIPSSAFPSIPSQTPRIPGVPAIPERFPPARFPIPVPKGGERERARRKALLLPGIEDTRAAECWRLSKDGASDALSLVVSVPLRTVSESNAREHWAARARRAKQQRTAVAFVVRGALHSRSPRCATVTLTRIAPRALDDDNLRGSLKACRDGVADALGIDDRDPRVSYAYAQRRGRAKQYAIEIAIVNTLDEKGVRHGR